MSNKQSNRTTTPPLPLPHDPRVVEFPCGLCYNEVNDNDPALICDMCKMWVHTTCNKISHRKYEYYQHNGEEEFICKKCKECKICCKTLAKNHLVLKCNCCDRRVHNKCNKYDKKDFETWKKNDNEKLFTCLDCLREALPLSHLTDKQVQLTSQGIDIPETVDLDHMGLGERQKEIIRRINENLQDDEIDEMDPVNCKYYDIEQFKSTKFNEIKHHSILHLNIHSLELHIEELRTSLLLLNHQFDFICITETKIKKNISPKFNTLLDGYQEPVGTPTEAGKGGVYIYVKNGIDYKPREDLNIYKAKELESYFLETINTQGKNTVVGVIYRHPCMDPTLFNEEYLQPLTDKLADQRKKIYITGDFNFDLLNTEHKETFNFFETMMSNHLLPTITIPTKINKKNSTVIDNIFTNQLHPDMKTGNLSIGISDHLISFLTVPRDNQNHIPKKHNLYIRCTKNFNREQFLLDYLAIDWDYELEADNNDANHSTDRFFEKMEQLFDKHMPLRKLTQKEFKKRLKPWITDEILEMISRKDAIFKRYITCKVEDRRKELHEEYKLIKNTTIITSLLTKTISKRYGKALKK